MVTIDEYAAWAARIGPLARTTADDPQELAYLGLGLAGETGEAVEHIKKLLRDGNWSPDGLAEELGDLIYYWARLCLATGREPSVVLEASQRKIAERFAAPR